MVQNRNKLIDLLIGNLSNYIVHTILEKSINKPELTMKYQKESLNSLNIAMSYRGRLNPAGKPLIESDIEYIKNKIISRVRSELVLRISKGYQGIDLSLIEKEVDNILMSTNIA